MESAESQHKLSRRGEIVVRVIISVVAFGAFFSLYYRQGTDEILADLTAHIAAALGHVEHSTGYSLLAPLIRITYGLGQLSGVACMLATASVIVLYEAEDLLATLVDRPRSLPLFLLGSLCVFSIAPYVPALHPNMFLGTEGAAAWHSPTIQLMNVFTLPAIKLFLVMWRSEDVSWRRLVAFSALCCLSAWAKPSFIVIFGPAVFCLCLCSGFWHDTRILKKCLLIGLTLVPVLGVLVFQSGALFGGASESSVRLGFAAVLSFRSHSLLTWVLLTFAFPLGVLVLAPRRMSEPFYVLAWLMAAFATFEYLVLYETGDRMFHGNFSWSMKPAMTYLMLASVASLLLASPYGGRGAHEEDGDSTRPAWLHAICWVLFLGHVSSGVVFFVGQLMGRSYLDFGEVMEFDAADFWPFVRGR